MHEKDYFQVILKDGSMTSRKTFEEVKRIPQNAIECILRAEFHHTGTGTTHKTDWFRYHIVDYYQRSITYRKGNYELVLIGSGSHEITNFYDRSVTIRKINTNKFFQYTSLNSYNFIFDEIRPLLELLNRFSDDNDAESFIQEFTCAHLDELIEYRKSPYQRLQEENGELKSTISELKDKLHKISELANV